MKWLDKRRAKKAAANGAALLDEESPGWETLIELEYLDIEDGRKCILGQVYGNYSHGKFALKLDARQAAEHGFLPNARPPQYVEEAWAEEVNARLVLA